MVFVPKLEKFTDTLPQYHLVVATTVAAASVLAGLVVGMREIGRVLVAFQVAALSAAAVYLVI